MMKDKKISVIGIGRSGVAAAKLGKYLGAHIFVSDKYDSASTKSNFEYLQKLGIDGEIGRHSNRIFNSDYIVISPGVSADSEVVIEAKKRKTSVISEVEFASLFTESPIIAVTGSNGSN